MQEQIHGYRLGDSSLPHSTITLADLSKMKEAVLFDDSDAEFLRKSGPILIPQTEQILDVWYGFVGSKSFLLESFSNPQTHEPQGDYLGKVRARFGKWIEDTAMANYDAHWLAWQMEIGRRHHRVGKNLTDGAESTALVPFRYLPLLAQPIVDTLRGFLEAGGDTRDDVDAMQNAWRKSVNLQVTLWSHPYIIQGDY